jgi:hypothetical protein
MPLQQTSLGAPVRVMQPYLCIDDAVLPALRACDACKAKATVHTHVNHGASTGHNAIRMPAAHAYWLAAVWHGLAAWLAGRVGGVGGWGGWEGTRQGLHAKTKPRHKQDATECTKQELGTSRSHPEVGDEVQTEQAGWHGSPTHQNKHARVARPCASRLKLSR